MRIIKYAFPLLWLGVAGHGANLALAQLPDTFTATGDMTTARYAHTATLLPNGKVLIAGGAYSGRGSVSSLTSAELYDPSTGMFTATGDMITPRQRHTATLLPNGKVLIVGGETCNDSSRCLLASAELYDPSTGIFTPTGNMRTARWGYTATLLNNGKVLIAGGSSHTVFAFASAELYDPSAGMFTATGNMTTPRSGHTATLLPNGNVLITGSGAWSGRVPDAEVYDPDAGEFRGAGGTIPEEPGYSLGEKPRTTQTLTVLANGKVLAMLESAESGDPDGAAIYDPAVGAFTETGETTILPYTTTLLPDATVLVTGYPLNKVAGDLTSVRYDPATSTFVTAGDMVTPRYTHRATLLPDGTVLMSGGRSLTAEIYVPSVVPVVTGLRFDRVSVATGSSYSAIFSGSNLTNEMFFDVRFTASRSNDSAVVLNWQTGLAATHSVPAGTPSGSWTINGVRAHLIETDHSRSFFPVSATITVFLAPSTQIFSDLGKAPQPH